MRMKRAYLTSLALAPAAIIPLTTATSCSQTWGFKTPLSIGSNIKGGSLDPFREFEDYSMVDLNGDPIIRQIQSNFAIDTRTNNYYGYSLPQKWNSEKEAQQEEGSPIKWDKGGFEDASAGWYDYSSSDFVKSASRTGERTLSGQTVKVSESLYSYRNNTLPSIIQLIGVIGSSINTFINYALQYQGTQIGTGWTSSEETDSNLGISWGGHVKHGTKESDENRSFFESVFAANAVSGTGKYSAVLHPTHVQFTFNKDNFPIPAYDFGGKEKVLGVHQHTLTLLNNEAVRPKEASVQYWSSVSDEVTEKGYDLKTDKTNEYKYKVYTYTNVPVIVHLQSVTKSYVNSRKNDSFIVSDYYSTTKDVKDSIGTSWAAKLPNFAGASATEPKFKSFEYDVVSNKKIIQPSDISTNYDFRLGTDKLSQNSFIVLLNYAYKEYESAKIDGKEIAYAELAGYDRVTMTGMSTVVPAYLIDKNVDLGETKFFKVANSTKEGKKGYIIDETKVNSYNNLFLELLKRNSGQGLITEAKNLNKTSQQLLKFLSYMFGDENLVVDSSKVIKAVELDK